MNEITIDATRFAVVVACSCGWRDLTGNRAGAWDLAARHLKHCHEDLAAARRADQAARDVRYRKRVQHPQTRHRGAGRAPQGRRDTSGPQHRTSSSIDREDPRF